MGQRLLVRPDKPIESIGLIVVPDKSKRPPSMGKVLQVGEGVTVAKVGERVLYSLYSGTDVTINKEFWKVLGEEEILAIVFGDETTELNTVSGGYDSNYASRD